MTVRAIPPISSEARVAGILAEVSPSANRFITSARPLSGRVMLRPISQLNARPIRTVATPTPMMIMLVRACDAISAVEAAVVRSLADAMISSAIGIMALVLKSMIATGGLILSSAATHSPKVSM
jgi:hypothetical protein